jgi:hypothetical protein
VRAALLSNANLGGDCCNRGMLLGALLGCVAGAESLPHDLVGGLLRAPGLAAALDAFVERTARQLLGQPAPGAVGDAAASAPVAMAAATVLPPRFGRPSPLPRRAYSAHSAVLAPRDFTAKLARMREHARAAGVVPQRLRYVRGAAGPFAVVEARGVRALAAPAGALQPLCAQFALLPVTVGGGARAVPAAPAAALAEGDAARDRAEVLGGGRFAPAIPAAAAHLYSSSSPALLSTEQLARLEADMGDAVFVEGEGEAREGAAAAAAGVGVFYYAPASELAARLSAIAAARAAAPPRDAVDPVSAALLRDYGVRVEIAPGWGVAPARAPEQAAPPCV